MTSGAHDLMLDLAAWKDSETGASWQLVKSVERDGVIDSQYELVLDGAPIGSMVLERLLSPAVIVIRSADLGPLAGKGVASRYYDWALPLVRDAGIERLGCNPTSGTELLLAKGWQENRWDGLGQLALPLNHET